MATLVADRFMCRSATTKNGGSDRGIEAIDLATGDIVSLLIGEAGGRIDQQEWIEACSTARARSSTTLGRFIDFGFIGQHQRFEARGFVRGSAESATDLGAHCARRQAELTTHALEWLDRPKPSSPRILYLRHLPDAREIRMRGFIPVKASLLAASPLAAEISQLIARRSVTLLDEAENRASLCIAFLKLACANARDVRAVVLLPSTGPIQRYGQSDPSGRGDREAATHAAERRAVYEACRPERRFTLRTSASMTDARAASMLNEGIRLLSKGRHAAAERTMRAAMAAFDRRDNFIHAADAAMQLGRLLLARGRAEDAVTMFSVAHDKYLRMPSGAGATQARIYAGVAQTDLDRLDEADTSLRAAHSAASALGEPELITFSVAALARNLFWQSRYADATAVLESVTPQGSSEMSARYWCLAGRLRLTTGDLQEAWRGVDRARKVAAATNDPGVEAIVRTAEAMVQGRLGDVEALGIHVRAGIRAARSAHQPLRAFRLRLTLVEGLLDTGHASRARALAGHLRAMTKRTIPALPRRRLNQMLERLTTDVIVSPPRRLTPLAHESVACFHVAAVPNTTGEIDGLAELIALCHDLGDEREALSRAAVAIRKQTHALGVGIFGSGAGQLAAAGSIRASLARRCIDLGQPIRPEHTGVGIEAANPIRYLGKVVGSVVVRWSLEGPEQSERAVAFVAAAASVCAPLVHALVEADSSPPAEDGKCELIGVSGAVQEVRRAITRAANAPFTVLIEGESGSGKELVARAIHRAGCRRERRFCALNCAAMPEDLVDAELFGYAKGAFTGAATERLGLFESAESGTVFLDEVAELSPRAQAKLLRALQEGEIRRIGENFTRSIDARLVTATNRSLRAEVEAHRFRQDLLYRLDVIRINIPPLRDRVEDIPLLAARFWRDVAERVGSKAVLGQAALSVLARYDWPGNVRELQNVLTGLVVSAPPRGVIGASEIPAAIARAARPLSHTSLESARLDFEQRFVRAALARAAGHRGRTATALGLSRQGLAKLLQRLHLDA